jgi:hypothetical protein
MTKPVPTFHRTGSEDPIANIAVPIIAHLDGESQVFGTGVIIGQHIAIVARHVFDEFIRHYFQTDIETLMRTRKRQFDRLSMEALQFVKAGKGGWRWRITKFHWSRLTDVMFVQIEPTNEEQLGYRFARPTIKISPPAIGERIAAFGFRCLKIEPVGDDGVFVCVDGFTSIGYVTDVLHVKKDDGFLSFPCFEVNARFDGGMSGGPVFDSTGRLCGIICSSLEPPAEDPNGEHISYVTTLWPMLSIPVTFNREGFPHDVSYPALELARGKFISCEGWEKVEINYDDRGDVSELKLHYV